MTNMAAVCRLSGLTLYPGGTQLCVNLHTLQFAVADVATVAAVAAVAPVTPAAAAVIWRLAAWFRVPGTSTSSIL